MELDWEYKQAGKYETFWFRNGYRYRIEKDPHRNNEWDCYYKWDNWTEKSPWKGKWRPMSVGTQKTLKKAKQRCWEHNRNPRQKYVFVERFEVENVRGGGEAYYFAKRLEKFGYLVFKPHEVGWNHTKKYLNPAQVGGEDVDARNQELKKRWIEIMGDENFYSTPYERRETLKKIVGEFDGTLPLWSERQREENLDRLSVQ